MRIFLLLLLVIGTGLATLGYWLSTGSRSLPFIESLVAAKVDGLISPFTADIENLRFQLDPKTLELATSVQKVLIRNASDKPIAMLPEIRLNLSAPDLLIGRAVFRRMEIRNPHVHVARNGEGRLTFNVEDEEGKESSEPYSVESTLGGFATSIRQMQVSRLVFRDARVAVDQADGTVRRWNVPRLGFHFTNPRGQLQMNATLLIRNDAGFNTRIATVSLLSADTKNSTNQLAFRKLPSTIVTMLHPSLAGLDGLDTMLSGTATLKTKGENIEGLSFAVEGEPGQFQNPELLPEPVTVKSLKAKGALGEGLSTLTLESAEAALEDFTLTANGTLGFGEGMTADMNINATALPLNAVHKYWPLGLSTVARDWITRNLRDGIITSTKARILIKPGDLEASPTPASVFLADLAIKDATVEYIPGYPVVSGATGTVQVTAQGLILHADAGTYLTGTVVKKCVLNIDDFTAAGVPMDVALDITTNAKDVTTILSQKYLKVAPQMKFNPETITGTAEGHIELTVPLYSEQLPKEKQDILYAIEADLHDLTQAGIQDKWNIEGLNGTLKLDNQKTIMKSQTKLQGVPATLNIDAATQGGDTVYEFKAELQPEELEKFSFASPDFIHGPLGINATITEKGVDSVTDAKIDITKASISFTDIALKKAAGVPGTLNAKISTDETIENIPAFELKSEGILVQGSLTENKKTEEILSFNAPVIRFGKTDAAVSYDTKGGVQVVSVTGKRLDLASQDAEETPTTAPPPPKEPAKADEKSPLEKLLNMQASIKLDELHFGEDSYLKDFNLNFQCGTAVCVSAAMSASTTNGKPVTFNLGKNEKGERSITMDSPDAGGVIQAFGITRHLQGGKLSYKATFADSEAGRPQKGRLLITDFTMVNAPVLAKIISLASLTGLLDTLGGNGINFKKLVTETSFDGTTAKFSKGKAYGSAIGITFSGSIKPFAGAVNLKGTVVPSYTANSMLGSIPLLGDILTGGDGGGIIAARYSVKGDTDTPSVMVNPLSLLTPGFLRNLFDVFDAPDEADKPKAATPAAAPSAPATTTTESTPAAAAAPAEKSKPAYPSARKKR